MKQTFYFMGLYTLVLTLGLSSLAQGGPSTGLGPYLLRHGMGINILTSAATWNSLVLVGKKIGVCQPPKQPYVIGNIRYVNQNGDNLTQYALDLSVNTVGWETIVTAKAWVSDYYGMFSLNGDIAFDYFIFCADPDPSQHQVCVGSAACMA